LGGERIGGGREPDPAEAGRADRRRVVPEDAVPALARPRARVQRPGVRAPVEPLQQDVMAVTLVLPVGDRAPPAPRARPDSPPRRADLGVHSSLPSPGAHTAPGARRGPEGAVAARAVMFANLDQDAEEVGRWPAHPGEGPKAAAAVPRGDGAAA